MTLAPPIEHPFPVGALGVAVYTTDAEGRITMFNDAAADLWGRRPEIGVDTWCGSWKLYYNDGRPMAHGECPMAVCLREGRAVRGESAVLERPDGSRSSFIPFPTPLFDERGQLTGAVNVMVDISAQTRAEAALRAQQKHLEALFRSSVAGIVELDPQARFTRVNDRFCELVGRSREELLDGLDSLSVTHPEDRERTADGFASLDELDFFVIEKRYLRPDGSVVWVHKGVASVRDEWGALVGGVAIVIDITDIVRTGEELAEANKKKDEFLSLVSHELRTPITTVLGNAKIIAERGRRLDEEQFQQAADDIKGEADRLNRIIDNLLTVARLESGQSAETEPLLIGRLLERVVASHRLHSHGHTYTLLLPEDYAVVEANEVHVEQTLKNLLGNAEKYAPTGTEVTVRGAIEGTEFVVSVEDRGVGIEPHEIESIFDPFYRVERTSGQAGIGIGLSVCRRLIEAMGGRIWAEAREGGGTRFAFALTLITDSLDD